MEDIQDGIKVSIQDGVTDDPAIPDVEEAIDISGKSYAGLIYIIKEIPHSIATTELATTTDSEDIDCSIASILGTGVA